MYANRGLNKRSKEEKAEAIRAGMESTKRQPGLWLPEKLVVALAQASVEQHSSKSKIIEEAHVAYFGEN